MKKHRLAWSLSLAIPVVLAIGSCGGDNGGGPPTGPGPTNETFNSGDLSTIAPTNLFVHQFANAGDFGYRCIHHAGMNGVVNVSAAGADTVSVTVASNSFTPDTAKVKTGGWVKWTNVSGIHTVTRP